MRLLLMRWLSPRWVVNTENGEMGLRILGVNLWYYKYSDPIVSVGDNWRESRKREFGEVVKSRLEED